MVQKRVSLRSPAGNIKGVEKALESGADVVYIGLSLESNLRNYSGLNFTPKETKKAVKMCHDKGKGFYVVINSYPQSKEMELSFKSVDVAAQLGVDAIVVSDLSVMSYAKTNHPDMKIHCSVQTGSANIETIRFYQEQFGAKCVVLPRVLTVPEIKDICEGTDIDIEVFAMGSLCTSFPGRCNMSQYITGESTNTVGICTSPKFMTFEENKDELSVKLNGVALNSFKPSELTPDLHVCKKGKNGAKAVKLQNEDGWDNTYLVNKRHICKGRFLNTANGKTTDAFHSTVILDVLPILPDLIEAGVNAFKIEGRQRPSEYSGNATRILRTAIDRYYEDPENYLVENNWSKVVSSMFKEMDPSTGPYLGR
jgi:putative protease